MNPCKTKHPNISLPRGWCWLKLSQLCTQDRCIVQAGSELASRLPYLSLEDIESNTGRILLEASYLPQQRGESTTFAFDSRHVLYGKLRPYLNKVALPNFSGRCTTELIPLLPLPDVSRRYLAWLLRQPETVAFAMQEKTGSRMPRANLETLLTLSVAVPKSLDEQEKIAALMDEEMSCIQRAKKACIEQLNLINELANRLLEDFPLMIEQNHQ